MTEVQHPDKTKTFGQLLLPAGTEDCQVTTTWPTVVLGHGFTLDHAHMEPYARAIAARGAVSYNIDFRGGSVTSRSDLTMEDMSVQTEADDMHFAADLMTQEHFCASDCLMLSGGSLGGVASTIEACRHPELYRALILIYPAFVAGDDARRDWPDPDNLPEDLCAVGFKVGERYARDLLDLDPFELMPSFKGPVLIIHGTADPVVPFSYAERAAQTFPNARLVSMEGSGHIFTGDALEKSCKIAADFMREVVDGGSDLDVRGPVRHVTVDDDNVPGFVI